MRTRAAAAAADEAGASGSSQGADAGMTDAFSPTDDSLLADAAEARAYNEALATELEALAEVYESGLASAHEPRLFRVVDERDLRRASSLRRAVRRIRGISAGSARTVRDATSLYQLLFGGRARSPREPEELPGATEASSGGSMGLTAKTRSPLSRLCFFDVLPAVDEFRLLWETHRRRGTPLERLREIRTFHDERGAQALTLFHCVWHAKRLRAMMWYGAGCRTLEDVASQCKLIDKRFQLGILYYDDFRLLIPYGEVAAITSVFASASTEIDADLSVIPVGALRRNHQECCDVDLVVTGERETLHPGGERYGSLRALIQLLRERHFITDEAVQIDAAVQRQERVRESALCSIDSLERLLGKAEGRNGMQHDGGRDGAIRTDPWAAGRSAMVGGSGGDGVVDEKARGALSPPETPGDGAASRRWWGGNDADDDIDAEDEVTWSGVVRLAGKPHRRVDVYVVEQEQLPWALIAYTGSREFYHALVERALRRGLCVSAHGVRRADRFAADTAPQRAGSKSTLHSGDERMQVVSANEYESGGEDEASLTRFRQVQTERDAFVALGLRYCEPPEREHAHALVECDDLRDDDTAGRDSE